MRESGWPSRPWGNRTIRPWHHGAWTSGTEDAEKAGCHERPPVCGELSSNRRAALQAHEGLAAEKRRLVAFDAEAHMRESGWPSRPWGNGTIKTMASQRLDIREQEDAEKAGCHERPPVCGELSLCEAGLVSRLPCPAPLTHLQAA